VRAFLAVLVFVLGVIGFVLILAAIFDKNLARWRL
jgi:hypothetical protein